MRETLFTAIQAHCKRHFGFTANMHQIRLWYFGQSKGMVPADRRAHRARVCELIAEWDVIIKLAMDYTKSVVVKSKRKWSDDEISAFVYYLIWSPYQTTQERKRKDGTFFHGATFWTFALENRHQIKPFVDSKAVASFKDALRTMLDRL